MFTYSGWNAAAYVAEEIREAVGDGSTWGLKVTYIPQEAPLGLAHCVLIAGDFLGDEDFVMYLGDNLLRQGVKAFVDRFESDGRSHSVAQILLARVDVASGVELVGLREVRLDPVRHPRRRGDDRALRDGVAHQLEVLLHHAHQDDQRWVQPQRLLERRLQDGDRAQRLEGHLGCVAVGIGGIERVELGDQGAQLQCGFSGAHAFGDHARAGENLLEAMAVRELDADLAVAAQVSGAGQHEVAKAGQAHQRLGLAAEPLVEGVQHLLSKQSPVTLCLHIVNGRDHLPGLQQQPGQSLAGGQPVAAIDLVLVVEIRKALLEHQVIFFRNQKLDPAQFMAIASPPKAFHGMRRYRPAIDWTDRPGLLDIGNGYLRCRLGHGYCLVSMFL